MISFYLAIYGILFRFHLGHCRAVRPRGCRSYLSVINMLPAISKLRKSISIYCAAGPTTHTQQHPLSSPAPLHAAACAGRTESSRVWTDGVQHKSFSSALQVAAMRCEFAYFATCCQMLRGFTPPHPLCPLSRSLSRSLSLSLSVSQHRCIFQIYPFHCRTPTFRSAFATDSNSNSYSSFVRFSFLFFDLWPSFQYNYAVSKIYMYIFLGARKCVHVFSRLAAKDSNISSVFKFSFEKLSLYGCSKTQRYYEL